jgi:transposase
LHISWDAVILEGMQQ